MNVSWLIPVEIWNHAVRALRRGRPRAGTYCLLLEMADGTIVSADPSASWQHPWFTTPRWDGRQWVATVKAGFVNGMDPTVPGVPSSSQPSALNSQPPPDADLIDAPIIPLHGFRAIPGDGENIPAFFQALGVRDLRDKLELNDVGGVTVQSIDIDDLPTRALVAMDFYLAVARATYESRAYVVDGSGTSGEVVDYSVTFNAENLNRLGSRARLMQAPRFPAVRVPTLEERLMGLHQDDGEDRLLVSTVYLLSPPDSMDGPPDQRWTPYVRHNQFWNLSHRARNLPPPRPPAPIRLFTGLLGGWGDLIGNQILSSVNEVSDRVLNAVNTTTNEGKFWTS